MSVMRTVNFEVVQVVIMIAFVMGMCVCVCGVVSSYE